MYLIPKYHVIVINKKHIFNTWVCTIRIRVIFKSQIEDISFAPVPLVTLKLWWTNSDAGKFYTGILNILFQQIENMGVKKIFVWVGIIGNLRLTGITGSMECYRITPDMFFLIHFFSYSCR